MGKTDNCKEVEANHVHLQVSQIVWNARALRSNALCRMPVSLTSKTDVKLPHLICTNQLV